MPRSDPRLGRARERGIVVLDIPSAWTVLGLLAPAPTALLPAPAPMPRPPGLPAGQVWAARALMAAGLVVMLFSVLALFGGAPFAGAFVLALFGVAALCTGWYLSEPAMN